MIRFAIRLLFWLFDTERYEEETIYVDPHYFASDFGIACTVSRTLPKPVWIVATSTRYIFCAPEHLFFDYYHQPTSPSELHEGCRIETEDGIETILVCRPLGLSAHMYNVRVVASGKRAHLNTANGFVSFQCSTGSTLVRVDGDLAPVSALVQRGPLDRFADWLESKLLICAARHLQ